MKPLVYIPEPIAASGLDLLKAECRCLTPWELENPSSPAAIFEADAVLVRLFQVDAEFIHRSGRLKVIAKHGVGVDNIDLQAARARGIPVVYTPAANANAVAEHTLALMLALSRHVEPAVAAVRAGRFEDRDQFRGIELAGKSLGVIGLGRIGSRLAEMAADGLQMNVLAYDPFVAAATYSGPARIVNSLEKLMRGADFLTIHVTLTADTRQLINARSLRWVRPGCRLINTSRGAIVDEAALITALEEGRLAGAALDVFAQEPLSENHPLIAAPNVLLTPHISSSTEESLDRMALQSAQGILDVLNSRPPEYVVPTEEA
jgi:D-3-phosphoglycerate dehydrogenase